MNKQDMYNLSAKMSLDQCEIVLLVSLSIVLKNWYTDICNGTIQEDEESRKFFINKIEIKHAEKRVSELIDRIIKHEHPELSFFFQTDPRGASIYIAKEQMNESNYSSVGIPIY